MKKSCSNSHTTIRDIKRYIDANYYENLSLDSLAKQFSVYPGFITSNMKKDYHITPQKYWTELRIAKSKEFLLNTHFDIPSIAKKVGYKNVYVYCRAFQIIEGSSPADFRNEAKRGSSLCQNTSTNK